MRSDQTSVAEAHDGITRAIVAEGERGTKRCARADDARATTRGRDDARGSWVRVGGGGNVGGCA